MSQHDFNIANQTAVNARTDINNALGALASLNSGNDAPSTTVANMLWYETDTNRLYMRNEANNAWLNFGYIDQAGGFRPLDNTPVVTTSGSQTGILGDQATSTWQAGTGTTESLVSPAKVKAVIPSSFSASLSSNGRVVLPNGIMFQWGSASGSANTNSTYTFPLAFPNSCFNVQTSVTRTTSISGNKSDYAFPNTITTTSFNVVIGLDNALSFLWFAVGY